MLLAVKTCAVCGFSLSLLLQHGFRGESGFKFFDFDIAKVFLVVPLYFLTDSLKIRGKKSSNLKSPIFFQSQLEKLALLEVRFLSMQLP